MVKIVVWVVHWKTPIEQTHYGLWLQEPLPSLVSWRTELSMAFLKPQMVRLSVLPVCSTMVDVALISLQKNAHTYPKKQLCLQALTYQIKS